MSVDLPSSTEPAVAKRTSSEGCAATRMAVRAGHGAQK